MKLLLCKKCPYCGDDNKRRLRRKSWMRLIPLSRLFECKTCQGEYLYIGFIDIGVSAGHNLLRSKKEEQDKKIKKKK